MLFLTNVFKILTEVINVLGTPRDTMLRNSPAQSKSRSKSALAIPNLAVNSQITSVPQSCWFLSLRNTLPQVFGNTWNSSFVFYLFCKVFFICTLSFIRRTQKRAREEVRDFGLGCNCSNVIWQDKTLLMKKMISSFLSPQQSPIYKIYHQVLEKQTSRGICWW